MIDRQTNMPKLLTPKEIKNYLKIGNEKVYKLFSKKSFPSFKIGNRYYIKMDKFMEWLDKQK